MEEIKTAIQELVDDLEVRVVAVTWRQSGTSRILEVQIDSPKGVDMDLCAAVSNKIDDYIDNNITAENYYLEVCSSGAEKQLLSEAQVRENIGQYVQVNFKEMCQGLNSFRGYLGVEGDNYTVSGFIKGRKKTVEFDYAAIEKIQLAVKI